MDPTVRDFLSGIASKGYWVAVTILGLSLVREWLSGVDNMPDEKPSLRRGALNWLAAVLHQSSKAITSGIVVLTALVSISAWVWSTFLEASVADEVKALAGSGEILEAVEGIAEEQTVQRILIQDLSRRVDGLEPEPVVAVYDPLRSAIEPTCVVGEPCNWSYFVRRANNDYGQTCGVPKSLRVFVDAAGVEHFPESVGTPNPRRLSTTATLLPGAFLVPEFAAEGPGEFFMRLTYENCVGNAVVKTETMKLVTTIVRE